MKTQPINQNEPPANIEARIRTMRTLWIAMLLSVGAYYVFTLFAGRVGNITPNPILVADFVCCSTINHTDFFSDQKQIVKQGRGTTASATGPTRLRGRLSGDGDPGAARVA